MKNKILKIVVVLLIIMFLCIGLVPDINLYLRDKITQEQYIYTIMLIVFITFEIIIYLKDNEQIKQTFNMMEDEIDFKKIKKQSKYKEDKTFYFRDFPFEKDLFKMFWIAFQYNIIKNRANILNALLLKWCKEDRIKFISKSKYQINNVEIPFDNENEEILFQLLKNVSKNKFIKLTVFNSKLIFKKINDILLNETSNFKKENKIIRYKNKDIISNSIKSDVDKVFGFKNFLLNFSNIDDKKPEEVKLWDEYLIYAELLGISKKVKQELKKANIDYSAGEIKLKKIYRKMIVLFKILIFISYLFYGIIFMIFTSFIWMIYINLTWN